ncbi:uncharacterized protein LOC133802682 isoform X2 [Humulus lupulus]|uniref:uncharacterized protein LOC133802682 isoform X2 n=1 Tax=Humulus lupulus TaxID=3486 RepID=UPI002B409A23|nr:uncharacterized protein LOC133802682 isoform X2 [Humulus lupulus]
MFNAPFMYYLIGMYWQVCSKFFQRNCSMDPCRGMEELSFLLTTEAIKKAKRVSPTKGIANIAKRERNSGAKQLDALMKELAAPLRTYMESFPKRHTIHPYERSLIELTLGDGNYHYIISRIIVIR